MTERTFTAAARLETGTDSMSDKAIEGARAYFNEGRCSGHSQFNGRYCRDVAGPEQWCIHCAGFMLIAALTAAAEREAAKDKEIARLTSYVEEQVAFVGGVMAALCQPTMTAPTTGMKLARYEHGGMLVKPLLDEFARRVDRAQDRANAAESALTAERQKAEELREWVEVALQEAPESGANKSIQRYDEGRIHAYGMVKWKLDALGLSPDAPQPPGTTRETP